MQENLLAAIQISGPLIVGAGKVTGVFEVQQSGSRYQSRALW